MTVLVRGCGDVGSAVAHRLFAIGERPRRIAEGVLAALESRK